MAANNRLTAHDFSGAGGPEHSEMLAQQLVDLDKRRLPHVMIECANSDTGARSRRKNCRQIVISRSGDSCAGNGMLRYTPPEPRCTAVRGDDFSQEVSNEKTL